jgi:hypothetical protein
MIAKPSTKAHECDDLNLFINSPDFDHLTDRAKKNALARKRGLEGERSTAHILDRHFFKSTDHALLHDLRIPDGIGGFAQFDHVILSRLSKTAAVIEVKNYKGRLSKNDHNEWLVWYEGRRRPVDIPNPTAQARRQREVLRAWLVAHRHDAAFEKIAAYVIIPPDCSIDRSKVGHDVPIYKADNFITAWTEFGGITNFGKLFSTGVSAASLQSIGRQLAASNVADERTIAEKIGASSSSTIIDVMASESQVKEPAIADAGPVEAPTDELHPVRKNSEIEPFTGVSDNNIPLSGAQTSSKAGEKVEILPGLFERQLPDGRIAFLAGADEGDRVRLSAACKGLAHWNPRFRNWIAGAEEAAAIREALFRGERMQGGSSNGAQ